MPPEKKTRVGRMALASSKGGNGGGGGEGGPPRLVSCSKIDVYSAQPEA